MRTKTVIDSTYNSLLKKNDVMGASIAIIENGKIVYATGYGFADYVNNIKANEKTVYRIGSCTKSFTALSILQLQERGLVNVNHSVKKYLPSLKITSRFKDDNEIYIKDMLCHTSGLPCDIANGSFCDTPPPIQWVIEELNKQTTISPRLYKAAYSNIAYGLLGEVISTVSKASYSDYISANIFKPLDMTSSFIENDGPLSSQVSKGYYLDKKELKEIKEPLIRDAGAGMISSNSLDMALYINMFLNRGSINGTQIVSSESIKEMEKNHLKDVLLTDVEAGGYGLYSKDALVKGNEKDSSLITIIGHTGDTYVFHSDFAYIPELNLGVVILTNSNHGGWIASSDDLLKIYIHEEKHRNLITGLSKKEQSKNNSDELCTGNDIIGDYNMGQLMIRVKNDKKIRFKQGPVRITFKRKKDDPGVYSARALAYGIIPINIKDQQFKFVRKNNTIFLKVIFTSTKAEDYIALKSSPGIFTDNWKKNVGKYQALEPIYKCADCRVMNMEGMKLELAHNKNYIVMKTSGKSSDTKNTVYLDVLSNTLSVTGGIGRGTGETVRILENGNIYYSGFEFKKTE